MPEGDLFHNQKGGGKLSIIRNNQQNYRNSRAILGGLVGSLETTRDLTLQACM